MAWRSGKLKRHLMLRQKWIACSLNIWLRPRLPFGSPCQAMFGSSQMSRVPSVLRCMFSSSWCGISEEPVYALRLPDVPALPWPGSICATKPVMTVQPALTAALATSVLRNTCSALSGAVVHSPASHAKKLPSLLIFGMAWLSQHGIRRSAIL